MNLVLIPVQAIEGRHHLGLLKYCDRRLGTVRGRSVSACDSRGLGLIYSQLPTDTLIKG
jgi:hypothetical protein